MSSRLAKNGSLNPEDLDGNLENKGEYSTFLRYGTAKLSQLSNVVTMERRILQDQDQDQDQDQEKERILNVNAVTPGKNHPTQTFDGH